MSIKDDRDSIKCDFSNSLEWRARKAEEYPHDPRNLRAVEILQHLEETADHLSPELMAEYSAIFVRWDTYEVVRLQSDALRAVGFHSYPADAAEFVRQLIETANADRRRFESPRFGLTSTTQA